MNKIQHITKLLTKFGLSNNQTTIYIFLVQHGEMRIQDIANAVNIPRSSVYESLDELLALGLIERIVDHKFIRIKPYPIHGIKHNLNDKLSHIESLLSQLSAIEKSIPLLPVISQKKSIVRYYKGISGARQLFWNTLSTKTIVYVYSEYGRSKFVGKNFYMDFVRESQERKILENVLINPSKRAISLIRRDLNTPIARTKLENIRILKKGKLITQGETFIYDNIYAQVYLDAEVINGFEVESTDFTKMQRSIFETLWKIAKPISTLL